MNEYLQLCEKYEVLFLHMNKIREGCINKEQGKFKEMFAQGVKDLR